MSKLIKTPSTESIEFCGNSMSDLDITYSSSLFDKIMANKLQKNRRYGNNNIYMLNSDNKTDEGICCICGGSELLVQCEQEDCRNFAHIHCYLALTMNSIQEARICPEHSNNQFKERLMLSHLTNRFNSDTQLVSLIKSHQTPTSQNNHLGNFFWFGIGYQYFSNIPEQRFVFKRESHKINTDFAPES